MSIHKSLVPASKLKRHRNVLTRTERLEILTKEERWKEGNSVFGLAKVRNIKIRAKAKVKKVEEAAVEGAAAPPATAGAPATAGKVATPTPAGKGASPAPAAAKGAAPAAPAKKEKK